MDLGLKGKVAVVTGASRGIGRQVATELAREGCDMVLAARDEKLLSEAATQVSALGCKAAMNAADLRSEAAVAALVSAAVSRFGRIDIVVHSAGATKRGDFFALADADFLDGFALKFMGAVRLTRAAWPHLVKAKGAMVNIIGMGGRYPSPDFTVGGTVNAALMNFTKAMAMRGVKEGVRVNAVNPGMIETERLRVRINSTMKEHKVDEAEARRLMLKDGGAARFGRPEEIAQLVCYLASPVSGFMAGALVDMDGGTARAI